MILECEKCKENFDREDLQESHDVPCYIFPGKSRVLRKQQADKFNRRLLCKQCHEIYEKFIVQTLFWNFFHEEIIKKEYDKNPWNPFMLKIHNYCINENNLNKCIKIVEKVKEDFFK